MSDHIKMSHPDSKGKEPTLVLPGQVENMKRQGWVVDGESHETSLKTNKGVKSDG